MGAFQKFSIRVYASGGNNYYHALATGTTLPACLITAARGPVLVGGREECANSAELVPHESSYYRKSGNFRC